MSQTGKTHKPREKSQSGSGNRFGATVPLIEQYYVAVDGQLKFGFGTYEAAEGAAKEIKKRFPNPQVTVFDSKKRSHTAIKQP
jgi:hypothetical protein